MSQQSNSVFYCITQLNRMFKNVISLCGPFLIHATIYSLRQTCREWFFNSFFYQFIYTSFKFCHYLIPVPYLWYTIFSYHSDNSLVIRCASITYANSLEVMLYTHFIVLAVHKCDIRLLYYENIKNVQNFD